MQFFCFRGLTLPQTSSQLYELINLIPLIARPPAGLLWCNCTCDWYWSRCKIISPDEHLLKQLSFTWFSINHVLVSDLIIRIFWGAFITSSASYVWINILLRHIIGDIERYLDHCVTNISLIFIKSIRNISICTKFIFLLNLRLWIKMSCFFLHILGLDEP